MKNQKGEGRSKEGGEGGEGQRWEGKVKGGRKVGREGQEWEGNVKSESGKESGRSKEKGGNVLGGEEESIAK